MSPPRSLGFRKQNLSGVNMKVSGNLSHWPTGQQSLNTSQLKHYSLAKIKVLPSRSHFRLQRCTHWNGKVDCVSHIVQLLLGETLKRGRKCQKKLRKGAKALSQHYGWENCTLRKQICSWCRWDMSVQKANNKYEVSVLSSCFPVVPQKCCSSRWQPVRWKLSAFLNLLRF